MSSSQAPPAGAGPPIRPAPRSGANPLMPSRRKPAKKPLDSTPPPSKPPAKAPAQIANQKSTPTSTPPQHPNPSSQPTLADDDGEEGEYEDIPIVSTKKALLDGMRYHVIRFAPNAAARVQDINPFDQDQFVRPVKLHRRDPEQLPFDRNDEAPSLDAKGNPVDDKEREKIAAQKAERRADREAINAQIAPTAKTSNKHKHKFQKQTEQVYQFTDSTQKKKDLQVRYEEKLPWHIDDYDNKNIWRGAYESALSERHLAFIPDQSDNGQQVFRMVPLEKWYRFTQRNQFKAVTHQQAEKIMNMKKERRDPKWLADLQKGIKDKNEETDRNRKTAQQHKLFVRKGERGEDKKQRRRPGEDDDDDLEQPEIDADIDEIDYNAEEEFADDEENEIFNQDDEEEKKDQLQRMKREQLEANVFELRDEVDYDAEEEEAQRKEEKNKKDKKKTQKSILKRERNFNYDVDSDEDFFASSSDSEDTEAERLEEEQRKKEQEQLQAQQEASKAGKAGDKPSSGASTKGTNTPTERPAKSTATNPVNKNLKRAQSPNMSEASGSESARKKPKKKHTTNVAGANGAGTSSRASSPGAPAPAPSGPISLAQQGGSASTSSNLKTSLDPNKPNGSTANRKRKGLSGAASGSDPETSDGGRARKNARLGVSGEGARASSPRATSPAFAAASAGGAGSRKGSRANSPNVSRPGSPAAGTSSNVASPPGGTSSINKGRTNGKATSPPARPSSPPPPLPSPEELLAKIPAEGVALNTFIGMFPPNVSKREGFIPAVRAVCSFDKKTQLLKPLNSG